MQLRKALLAGVVAVGLVVPVSGCALFQNAQQTTDTVLLEADRALVTAHHVWEGASYTLQALANSGVLKGNAAAVAKKYYDQATEFLKQADHYRDIGNAALTQQFANAAIAAVALATTQKGE